MSGLVEKLEAAEGGSRELDEAIWLACGLERKVSGPVDAGKGVWAGPHVSYSLDAALALAERVIAVRGPIDISIMGSAQVVILDADPCRDAIAEAYGNTPALALCIAILRALNLNETRHAE